MTLLARYQFSDQARLEFGYARKTRSPNLYERYSWGRSTMAMTMVAMAIAVDTAASPAAAAHQPLAAPVCLTHGRCCGHGPLRLLRGTKSAL